MNKQEYEARIEELNNKLVASEQEKNYLTKLQDGTNTELQAIKESNEYKTLQYISQFVSEEAPNVATDNDGITVLTVNGKDYDITSQDDVACVQRCVGIFRMKDATKTAQYFALVEVRERKVYERLGFKSINEYAKALCDVQPKTAGEYLATIDTFFDIDENTFECKPKSALYRKASLTNLKQAKGFFNDECAGQIELFEQAIRDGLPINGTLSALKDYFKDEEKDVDKAKAKEEKQAKASEAGEAGEASEAGEAGEAKEVDTPERQARFYAGKLMNVLLEVAKDETEKEFVISNIERLLAILGSEC